MATEGSTLRVNPDVIRTLEALVTALPQGGPEIGGLLLGYEGYDGSELRLESVHAVGIADLSGPPYQLSDSDLKLIQQTIERLSGEFWFRVVGHFRSHRTGDLEITTADRTIAALTGEPKPLVLLIQGSSIGPSVARLYRSSSEGCEELLEFSIASTVAPPAVSLEESPPESAVAPTPADRPAPPQTAARELPSPEILWRKSFLEAAMAHTLRSLEQDSDPAIGHRDSADRPWWKILFVTGLLACVTFANFILSPAKPRPSADPKARLGIFVRQAGGQLIVGWDPPSPAARDGISGLLTIYDGTDRRKIPLTATQLGSGRMGYAPQTSAVEFRLEVYRGQLRYADEAVMAAVDPPEPSAKRMAQERTAHRPVIRPVVRKESPGGDAKLVPAPSLRQDPPPETETAETSGSSGTDTSSTSGQSSESLPEIAPPPEVAQALPPRIPDASPILAASRSSFAQPKMMPSTVSYVSPIPVRKTSPSVPANLRTLIQDGVSIEVKVAIDTRGQVTGALPLSSSSSNWKLLSPVAVQAARLWRFEPARQDGKPVRSETVLKFNFEPRTR
jgi:outer membrane biosynthesis protein TonB